MCLPLIYARAVPGERIAVQGEHIGSPLQLERASCRGKPVCLPLIYARAVQGEHIGSPLLENKLVPETWRGYRAICLYNRAARPSP